ncbi:MAG: exopolyphosphatase [Bacteroidota bacterium]|nr:exopolyphosphatase [Bacteroidota bacterium]
MRTDNYAVLDLGTNTFNLLILNIGSTSKTILHQDRYAVKIGKGGIHDQIITDDAFNRAVDAVAYFKKEINKHHVPLENVKAVATSAFRNAINGVELADKIKEKTGIEVEIIAGEREAELIYYGVKSALTIGDETSLIMDIGGGSVEFIICDENNIFWKKSYEIGAQRLLDIYHKTDPIQSEQIERLYIFLEKTLTDLQKNINLFKPRTLIGSSGTFDTLCEIYLQKNNIDHILDSGTEFELPLNAFGELFLQLVSKNVEERKKIPGMSEMRVDMIVVASCLIDYVLKSFYFNKMRVSFYSLKEGIFYLMTNNQLVLEEEMA